MSTVEASGYEVPRVCSTCNDTHRIPLRDGEVMCTHCPVPCQDCRLSGVGSYCATIPCACECHLEARPAANPIDEYRADLVKLREELEVLRAANRAAAADRDRLIDQHTGERLLDATAHKAAIENREREHKANIEQLVAEYEKSEVRLLAKLRTANHKLKRWADVGKVWREHDYKMLLGELEQEAVGACSLAPDCNAHTRYEAWESLVRALSNAMEGA